MIRDPLKRLAERALLWTGAPNLARKTRRRDTIILAYHNIVPEGALVGGEVTLHLPVARFAAQLEALAETHDVIPLDAITAEPSGGRPRAVITFDDAYRGAVTTGVETVVRFGMPFTVFVSPAFVGGKDFWWDRLGSSRLGSGWRERALFELAGRDAAIADWQRAEGIDLPRLPEHSLCASVAELNAALSRPGCTVGSHSWSHPNFLRLTPQEQRAEFTQSMEWLRERFANFIPWFSYPYGLSNASVAALAFETGYAGGVVLGERWASEAQSVHQVPRFNIPAGLTLDGFRLRISGMISG